MKNIIKIFFSIIIVVSIAIIGNVLINRFAPEFLLLSNDKVHTLTLTVWQVQALFTSIVIAINALALGFLNNKVYGVGVLEFSFTKDKLFKLSQSNLIIIMFLIVFINYYFVAYEALFGVLFLFTVSILCIGIIFSKTVVLITQFESVRTKIKSFILTRYMKSNTKDENLQVIKRISEHNKISFINNQTDVIISNSYLLLDLSFILSSLNKQKVSNEEVSLHKKKIEHELQEIIKMLSERDQVVKTIEIGHEIIRHSIENNFHLQIERDFFYFLLKQLKYMKILPTDYTLYYYKLIYLIGDHVSNLTNEKKPKNNDEISSYDLDLLAKIISGSYTSIKKNKALDNEEKLRFYRILRDFIYFNNNDKYKYYYLMFLLRQTIIQKDVKNFKFFLVHFNIDTFDALKMQLTLTIYLYYLIYKEELVDGVDYKKFLKFNDFFTLNIYIKQFDYKYFRECFYEKELSVWEEMEEGNAKWMIMDNVIKEFFVLLEINNPGNLIDKIHGNEILSFINILSNKNQLINKIHEIESNLSLKIFNKAQLSNKITSLKNKLKKEYIKNELEEYEDINLDNINKRITSTSTYFNLNDKDYIKDKTLLKQFKENLNLKTKPIRHQTRYPKLLFKENYNLKQILNQIEEDIIKGLNQYIITNLNNKVLISTSNRNNKSELLIKHLNNDKHSTILTNINMNYLKWFEKTTYDKYEKETKKFKVINIEERINNRVWLSTNPENIEVFFESVNINVRELSVEEVEYFLKKHKKTDDLYEIPIVNDIISKFNKEEAFQYLHAIESVVEIEIYIGIKDKNKKRNNLIVF